MTRLIQRSPCMTARIAGLFYVIVFVTGIFALFNPSGAGFAAGMIAGVFYIVVTVLFYLIFKPVDRTISFLAAIISLVGIIIGPLSLLIKPLGRISPLIFFGFYCLLISYLIFKSTFLPRFLASLMAFAGLGWLTFFWPSFAASLSPYIFLPGIIGEGTLTLWLVVMGVNEPQWKEQASAAQRATSL